MGGIKLKGVKMLTHLSERVMHRVRWFLTIGWLILILSLFHDPVSIWLTDPNSTWSFLRVNPAHCHRIQGVCQPEAAYPIGARLFWAAIIPCSIFILLVFGHNLWRRVCPLSFLSQLPLALGFQRRIRQVEPSTGRVRSVVAKVSNNSWLGRNRLYLQFALLFVGLCMRLLFINGDRLFLALFLISTIICAIFVGYWFGGKSWCHYFCPMAPVQLIFAEPAGLLTSSARSPQRSLPQSMCRTVDRRGQEKSACVNCIKPCFDIDSERDYWESITHPDRKFIHYAYIGLVFGFYFYFFLYAGNWDYYFSAYWTHDDHLKALGNPGFYIFGRAIAIHRAVAVLLTLALFSAATYYLGMSIEKFYKAYLCRNKKYPGAEQFQHRLFTVYTYIAFNLFFHFGGRPTVILFPLPVQYVYNTILVVASTLWLYKTWGKIYRRSSAKTIPAVEHHNRCPL